MQNTNFYYYVMSTITQFQKFDFSQVAVVTKSLYQLSQFGLYEAACASVVSTLFPRSVSLLLCLPRRGLM